MFYTFSSATTSIYNAYVLSTFMHCIHYRTDWLRSGLGLPKQTQSKSRADHEQMGSEPREQTQISEAF